MNKRLFRFAMLSALLAMPAIAGAATIRGKITDHRGRGLANARVKVIDLDPRPPGGVLGITTTDRNGNYRIKYNEKKRWDGWDISDNAGRPDVFIRVYTRGHGGWGEVWNNKRRPAMNWPGSRPLVINGSRVTTADEEKSTAFNPSRHGYAFENNKLLDVPWARYCRNARLGSMCQQIARLLKNAPQNLRKWYVCGGMSLSALRHFSKTRGRAMNHRQRTQRDVNMLLSTQIDTMFSPGSPPMPTNLTKMIRFHLAPNVPHRGVSDHTVGHLTKGEWQRLRVRLRQNRPTLITLLRRIGNRVGGFPGNMAVKNHQVAVIGYRWRGVTRELFLKLYDPNHANRVSWAGFRFGMHKRNLYGREWTCSKGSTGWCNPTTLTRMKPRGFIVSDVQGEHHVKSPSKLGARCSKNNQCKSGACDAGWGTSKTNTCVPRGRSGNNRDHCSNSNQCKSGSCNGLRALSGGRWKPGTCGNKPKPPAKKSLGRSCSNNNQCKSGACDAGWGTSKTNTCVPRGKRGNNRDHCSNNNQCRSGYCQGLRPLSGGRWSPGRCATKSRPKPPSKKKLGRSCSNHNQCQSGACDAGWGTSKTNTCVPRGPTGRSGHHCSNNNQCRSGTCRGLRPLSGGRWKPGTCR